MLMKCLVRLQRCNLLFCGKHNGQQTVLDFTRVRRSSADCPQAYAQNIHKTLPRRVGRCLQGLGMASAVSCKSADFDNVVAASLAHPGRQWFGRMRLDNKVSASLAVAAKPGLVELNHRLHVFVSLAAKTYPNSTRHHDHEHSS